MALGVPEFRRALVKLGDALDSDVVKLVGALATQDTAGALALITDAYPELVTPYLAAAGDLSATWYEDQAPDVDFLAEPAELPSIEQLAANGRYALTTSKPASVLSGAAKRQLFKTHRDTILENAEREGVAWVREARPGACGFCRMLATRVLTEGFGGAPGLYLSEDTANANPHTEDAEGHDHCRCVSVPIRAGQPYRVPAYVAGWLDDYEAVSRDDDGRLLPVWKIADEMEKRGAQRGNPVEPPAGGPATAAIVALDEKRPATSSTRAPDGSPLALTAAPVRLAIEARKATTAPAPGDVADWLAANDQNWAALEAFRALDSIELPPAEREPDPGPVKPKTIGDQLLAALDAAKLALAEPDGRLSATAKQKSQRKGARAIAVREAQRALDDAIADGTASQPIAPAKGKRAKSRPFAEVEAERRAAADVAIDEAVAAFEAACATGDDEQIAATCDAMEALEAAEQERRDRADAQLAKIAEKHERQRQRRDAERLAIQDEIAAVAEANEAESDADYWQAEAEVMARRTGKSTDEVLVAIRKREFIRTAGFKGNGFEDTLKNEFAHLVEQAYMQAEDATNGVMIRKGSKFDSKQLWYCNDATARRHMSEEMAAWFDEHGRLTLPVLREMVLSGENFANLTVMNQDYLQ
ncbi:capsid maturation protease [Mycobacterium phage Lemuria]|uniref:Capsid maturation protease n=1 Tax=Mycobacterium phage Lemuria TaxID=2599868 RepID=A0A5J6TJ48_9CAUD|nr:head maturation protease [Mycobacterium phage Lemuria]QFG10084.1 capsid maturation protease [Mycobacterium phage Lemuria]